MKIEISKQTLFDLIDDAEQLMNKSYTEERKEYFRGLRDAYKSILILEVTR